MNKKILFLFVGMIAVMFVAFTYFSNRGKVEEEPEEVVVKDEKLLIGDINNIELYVTDYRYDNTLKGYNYTKVDISNPEAVKLALANVDLNDYTNDVIYGKYKLVIDDKTIFFDPNTDTAYYLEQNKTFKLTQNIKNSFATTSDTCSCCNNELNCKINLCACPN